jgi:hypothetical protein
MKNKEREFVSLDPDLELHLVKFIYLKGSGNYENKINNKRLKTIARKIVQRIIFFNEQTKQANEIKQFIYDNVICEAFKDGRIKRKPISREKKNEN